MLIISDSDVIIESLPCESDKVEKFLFNDLVSDIQYAEKRLLESADAESVFYIYRAKNGDKYIKFINSNYVPITLREETKRLLGNHKLFKEVAMHYLACAFWLEQSDDENEIHFEQTHDIDDLSNDAVGAILLDVIDFVTVVNREFPDWQEEVEPEMLGHDFFLTRNGHGSGFWDRDYETEGLGDKLTALCKPYGEQGLYLGDDGLIYSHS